MYSDAFRISESTVPDSRTFSCEESKHPCIAQSVHYMTKNISKYSTHISIADIAHRFFKQKHPLKIN